MKILYLHQYFSTPTMAGGTRSYEMAKRMVEGGHEVHMVSSWRLDSKKSGWTQENIDGINVHWLSVRYNNKMGSLKRIVAFLKFAILAGPRARLIGGDLVFASSTPLTIALPAIHAAKRLKIPMVFEVRDLWPELPIAIGAIRNRLIIRLTRWLERYAYLNSSRIIALSPGMADGICKSGYPRKHVKVIPNSCDNTLFYPSDALAQQFRLDHPELGHRKIVLYAGTFGRINGVGFLPELAARLKSKHPDVCFVSIGSGAEFESVRLKADRLGVLQKNYFQYESMPKTDLVKAFQAATISMSLFIDLPEMRHNSANKFFDTLASGTAVAINYGGWQKDIIKQHKVGISLSPTVNIAAKQLSKLFQNSHEIHAMSIAARYLAENSFDRDTLAQSLISVLRETRIDQN